MTAKEYYNQSPEARRQAIVHISVGFARRIEIERWARKKWDKLPKFIREAIQETYEKGRSYLPK